MGLYDTLCSIVQEVGTNGNCQGMVEVVIQAAAKKDLFGDKLRAVSKSGSIIVRINAANGNIPCNFHEVWGYRGHIVDPDSPKRVYQENEYVLSCFRNQADVKLEFFEEA